MKYTVFITYQYHNSPNIWDKQFGGTIGLFKTLDALDEWKRIFSSFVTVLTEVEEIVDYDGSIRVQSRI